MNKIILHCQYCGEPKEVSINQRGRKVSCFRCKKQRLILWARLHPKKDKQENTEVFHRNHINDENTMEVIHKM